MLLATVLTLLFLTPLGSEGVRGEALTSERFGSQVISSEVIGLQLLSTKKSDPKVALQIEYCGNFSLLG
jgi:hypothetical protein